MRDRESTEVSWRGRTRWGTSPAAGGEALWAVITRPFTIQNGRTVFILGHNYRVEMKPTTAARLAHIGNWLGPKGPTREEAHLTTTSAASPPRPFRWPPRRSAAPAAAAARLIRSLRSHAQAHLSAMLLPSRRLAACVHMGETWTCMPAKPVKFHLPVAPAWRALRHLQDLQPFSIQPHPQKEEKVCTL